MPTLPGFSNQSAGDYISDKLNLGNSPQYGASLNNLYEIINSNGFVDPGLRNRKQSDIGARAQGQQQGYAQAAARMGLGGSNLVGALKTAAGATGARDINNQDLAYAASVEEQKRADLGKVMDMIVNPSFDINEADKAIQGYNNAAGAASSAARQQRTMATISTIIGIIGLAMCWVAREIFGEDDPRWLDARHYMMNIAPPELTANYLMNGEELAAEVRRSPALRAELTPVFIEFARRGREAR